jgi:hypothetical protein
MTDDATVRAELQRRGLGFEHYASLAHELLGGPKFELPRPPSQAQRDERAARVLRLMWLDDLARKG